MSEPRMACFQQRRGAGQAHCRPPLPEASFRATCPTLEISGRFTGSLGSCLGKQKPSLPPRGPCFFPRTTLPSSSPTPPEAECPGKTWGPGAPAGAGHHPSPGGEGLGGRDAPPRKGAPEGTQTCDPPARLRVLFRCNCINLERGSKLANNSFHCQSRAYTMRERTVIATNLVPPGSNPHPCEGIRGPKSLLSAKGIHLRLTWVPVSRTRPHGRKLGRPLEPLGQGWAFSPGLSRGPGALSRPESVHVVP